MARPDRTSRKTVNRTSDSQSNQGPNVGVFHGQRVRARNQRHYGVSEFLGSMGEMVFKRDQEKTLTMAERDAVGEGPMDEEMEGNWLYQQTFNKGRGRVDALRAAASISNEDLGQAYNTAADAGEEFDPVAYVDGKFGDLENSPLWKNPDYRAVITEAKAEAAAKVGGVAASLEASRVLQQTETQVADFADTALQFADFANATPGAGDSTNATLDAIANFGSEHGLTNKQSRATAVESLMTRMEQVETAEEVDGILETAKSWLGKRDSGLLRRVTPDLEKLADQSRRKVETAREEAESEFAMERNENYNSLRSRLRREPGNVSIAEMRQMANDGQLGVGEDQNNRRYLTALDMRDRALLADEKEAAADKAKKELYEGFGQVSPERYTLMNNDTREAYDEWRTERAREPVGTLWDLGRQAAQASDGQALSQATQGIIDSLGGEAGEHIQLAMDVGGDIPIVTDLLNSAGSLDSPMLGAGAAVAHEIIGKYGVGALGSVGQKKLSVFEEYHRMVNQSGVDPAVATEVLQTRADVDPQEAINALDEENLDDDVEDLLAEYPSRIAEELRENIAYEYHVTRDINKALKNAKAFVDSSYTRVDGHLVSKAGVPDGVFETYDTEVKDRVYTKLRSFGVEMPEDTTDIQMVQPKGNAFRGDYMLVDTNKAMGYLTYPEGTHIGNEDVGGTPIRINLIEAVQSNLEPARRAAREKERERGERERAERLAGNWTDVPDEGAIEGIDRNQWPNFRGARGGDRPRDGFPDSIEDVPLYQMLSEYNRLNEEAKAARKSIHYIP